MCASVCVSVCISSNYFGPPLNDCAVCQLSPVIVTFCQLPIFDLGSQKSLQSPLCLCCSLGSFMTILMQFSKIKCIFYDSFRESAPLGAERERALPTCQPLRLPFISLVYYVCVRFYLRFDFYIVYLLFLLPSSTPCLFALRVCQSLYFYLFRQ